MALPIKTDLFSRTLPISLQLHSYGSPTMLCPAPFFPGYDRCVTAIHSQHATNYAVSASWYAVCRLSLRGSSTVSPFWREVVRVGLCTDIDDALTVARVWPFFFITHFPVLMSQAAG
jgi:hypothetical protein